jgi:L-aminopeptidase/D-esterase-like protein
MLGIFRGQRPDITPAQVIAGIPIVGETAHAFGVFTLSAPQQDSLEKVVLWAFALVAGDAVLRVGRNLKDGKVEAAALASPAVPHDTVIPVEDLDEVDEDLELADDLEDEELPEPIEAAPEGERQQP